MFPLTHMAVAEKVLGQENQKTILGSLLPDFVSFLGVGRNLGHEMGFDLYHYAQEFDKNYVDLALGVLTHGTCLPGLDTYADEAYHGEAMGFCFLEGRKISEEAARICCLPPSMALWKSHNIIEMAFDALTAERIPDIGQRGEAALAHVDESLCRFLSEYFRVEVQKVAEMFQVVPEQFSFDGTDHEVMMKKFLRSLERRHGIVGGNLTEATDLLETAIKIVKPQYDGFMGEVVPAITDALAFARC
ncbi:MAG: hypothetical protein U0M15_05315 [Bacillota bacterium]|nr:hypothetical protein [Bacillota bacterium]